MPRAARLAPPLVLAVGLLLGAGHPLRLGAQDATPAAGGAAPLVVDDDGAQCPSAAFRDIQAAVAAAAAGATVLVCAGTYTGTVAIAGAAKDGLRLVAAGSREAVVLDGNPAADAPVEANGIELADVAGVLVEGFTVRNYHDNIVLLPGAAGNTVRHNAAVGPSGHDGIRLEGAHGNVIEHNLATGNGGPGNGCGIDVQAGSSNNVVRHNAVAANPRAGIRLQQAGPGNLVQDNTASDGGRNGILNQETAGTRIEGNRAHHNPGVEADAGAGIRVLGSSDVAVARNAAFGNGGADLVWDGAGAGNAFAGNYCLTSSPAGLCAAAVAGTPTAATPAP